MNDTLDAMTRPETGAEGDDIRRLVAAAVREALPSRAADRTSRPAEQSLVLELDRAQFARAVYRSDDEERRRVGVSLTKGGL